MAGKLIIFSAPSGAGKSTLVNYILELGFNLEFSVSATSRAPRGSEINAREYYFLSPDEFRQRIENKEFIEYEEVYPDCYYGTLRTEIERITANGNNIIFDVDVVGGLNIKKQYPDNSLSLFIAPPSVEELQKRLIQRATDTAEMIKKRVDKAAFEMTFAPQFDAIVINDNLDIAKAETERLIREFLV